MKPIRQTPEPENKPTSTAYIPYINNTYGRLSRMLAKYNIKSVTLPHRKITSYLPPVKDAIGLKTPGIRGLSKKYPTFGGEKYISYVTGLGP